MPIKIPNKLPAKEILQKENVFLMTERRALMQDIRPLKIVVLNLMPTKIDTETQLLRLLSNSPLQIEITLLNTATHISKNTSHEHLKNFYCYFDDIKDKKFDGLIITGAPVETIEFEQVDYWDELCSIMEWSKHNVFSTLYICWGAQAGLYYHYGINKHKVSKKISGIFSHKLLEPNHNIVKGFDERFNAPHSRYTQIKREDIIANPKLSIIAESKDAGLFLVASKSNRRFFIMGHPEYDRDTLKNEYIRDIKKGLDIEMPKNYFPDNNPSKRPIQTWKSHASLLFSNWLNFFVYQETPFDTDKIK